MSNPECVEPSSEIAIVGMAGRFPGAQSLDEFWRNLRDGVESISFYPENEPRAATKHEQFSDGRIVRAGAPLTDPELFDASFFGFTPREAEIADPQQRLFLECAWEALESGGYSPETFNGRIGVYAGASASDYFMRVWSNADIKVSTGTFQIEIGNDKDYLATRVSYKLNLRGPSVTVQTACSTSLVAVHIACQALLDYECDMALAGGVSVKHSRGQGYVYQAGGIMSPDGHCRAFDARAEGTVGGDGLGVVLLKRLQDALDDGDTILAAIKGSAINNDGSLKVGFTAPSVDGQAEVIAQALANAGACPETISYVETHGTATQLGDPIEIAALNKAFRAGSGKPNSCAIGSLKTNIGHLNTAAGVAGLIKTVLALRHRQIPPSLHFEKPNPKIDFACGPFYVNAKLAEWRRNGAPRRAGVSSFGIGGTNAHVIVEEAPRPSETTRGSRPLHLLTLSARTESALERMTANLLSWLKVTPDADLADVAYTLHLGRSVFKHRRFLVCRDVEDAIRALEMPDVGRVETGFADQRDRSVAFMFAGQGAQHTQMARELYHAEEVFRAEVDSAAEYLRAAFGFDLRETLYPPEASAAEASRRLEQTSLAQPALFVIEYALAKMWQALGVQPQAFIGHSLGEYAAACLSGVLSLEDALSLVALRGRLMQQQPRGLMLAVALSEEELAPLLKDGLSLAAINGPTICVVSGTVEAVEELERVLAARGVGSRRLHTSHAFHSEMMEPVIETFTEHVKRIDLHTPVIPFVSTLTGTWITNEAATDPVYWGRRHLRGTVRLSDGLAELLKQPERVLLEVGPGHTLSTLVRQHPHRTVQHVVLSSLPARDATKPDYAVVLETLGRLWLSGCAVNWAAFHAGERRRRIPLPTYPFERERFWVEHDGSAPDIQGVRHDTDTRCDVRLDEEGDVLEEMERLKSTAPVHARPALDTDYCAPRNVVENILVNIWQEAFGIQSIGIYDKFLELGGQSLLAVQIITRVRATFQVELPLQVLFESETVAELAQRIMDQQLTADEIEELEQLYQEIGDLPADEVKKQLADESSQITVGPTETTNVSTEVSRQPEYSTSHRAAAAEMQFSLLFFSDDGAKTSRHKYRLILDSAKHADAHDFSAVWIPERHFQPFGGLYPNPSVLAAALAAVTERIQIRAGSVALPLHNPIRVAEEWAMVDNLSDGRVGISFASGWHPDDFVLSPQAYAERKELMFRQIEIVQRLWEGEAVCFTGADCREVEVRTLPRPVQARLPVWITSSSSLKTWVRAGEIGAGMLVGLMGETFEGLSEKIGLYRESLARNGFDSRSRSVTVMLHTFVGEDLGAIKELVRDPLINYLRTFIKQTEHLHREAAGNGGRGAVEQDKDALVSFAFERLFNTSSLLGTPETCKVLVERLAALGVDEIACLVDFGLDAPTVLNGLHHLNELRALLRATSPQNPRSLSEAVSTTLR